MLRQSQGATGLFVLVAAILFAVMTARALWYEAIHWPINEELPHFFAQHVVAFAHGVFLTAFAIGILAWAYVCRIPVASLPMTYQHFKRGLILPIAASALLFCTLAGDAWLTMGRLHFALTPDVAAVPISAIAIEIGCALLLIRQLTKALRVRAAI